MLTDLLRRPEVRRALAERDIAAFYRYLQEAGVSQRQIAQLTGQSQSEVSEIVAGRTVISYSVLVRIAAAFGIPRGHMGLAYVDTPMLWQHPPPVPPQPVPLEPRRRRPAPPLRWEPLQIKALREAMRRSVREFANHLGVSDRTISNWEAGSRPRPDHQAALDTALARAGHEVQVVFAGSPISGAAKLAGADWVLHLPVRAPNLAAALTLAETAVEAVAHLPRLVTADATVSAHHRPHERFPVFCHRVLDDGTPCCGRNGHEDPCAGRPRRTPSDEGVDE